MVEDYEINHKTSVLFLSLAWHRTYPRYIIDRLSELYNRKRDNKKILLVKHDIQDENNIINNIYTACMKFEATCIVCWSDEEAAQYLHTFKSYETKTDMLLQGKNEVGRLNKQLLQEWDGNQNLTHISLSENILSSIRRINKTDAKNLMRNYGSVEKIMECRDYNDFLQIDGIGGSKVESLLQCFRGPFDPEKKIYRPEKAAAGSEELGEAKDEGRKNEKDVMVDKHDCW